jgi:hypothetical protein
VIICVPTTEVPKKIQKRPSKHLFVDALYLLKTGETNYSVNVTVTLYITNTWNDTESGDVKIITYVIDRDRGIATNKSKTMVGKIDKNVTKEVEIPITLINSSSKVDFLIFENEKLILKGDVSVEITRVVTAKLYDVAHEGRWTILQKDWNIIYLDRQ